MTSTESAEKNKTLQEKRAFCKRNNRKLTAGFCKEKGVVSMVRIEMKFYGFIESR